MYFEAFTIKQESIKKIFNSITSPNRGKQERENYMVLRTIKEIAVKCTRDYKSNLGKDLRKSDEIKRRWKYFIETFYK